MTGTAPKRWLLALAVLAGLFVLQALLPDYHHTNFARIMVLASFAVGYNIAFGYTGLLSLGHAMFFAAGIYAAGLSAQLLGVSMPGALGLGALPPQARPRPTPSATSWWRSSAS